MSVVHNNIVATVENILHRAMADIEASSLIIDNSAAAQGCRLMG